MKKIILILAILTLGLSMFSQIYDDDKTITGLDISTNILDSDYAIIQKVSAIKATAIRMDSIKSYMVEAMTADIPELDSVSGETGQFVISDGVGWLTPVSAKYEGLGAYSFGYRDGTTGWGSFLIGGSPIGGNIASASGTFVGGADSEASGIYGFAWNGTATANRSISFGGTASGISSFCGGLSGSEASGDYSFAFNGDASGDYSFAGGGSVLSISEAIGNYSFAFGSGTEASGNQSASLCGGTTASGDYSIATGRNTTASGEASFATGYNGLASSSYSASFGYETFASGRSSAAFGSQTVAESHSEFVIGSYTDLATSPSATSWVLTDRLFTISNGTGIGSESNALVMLKNGNTTASGQWNFNSIQIQDTSYALETDAGEIANDADGDLMQWDGSEWQKFNKACGDYLVSAYVPEDSTLTTTTTVADTWYFMGTGATNKFVNYENQGFTFTGDTLQFAGTDTTRFLLIYNGSLLASTINKRVSITISINDVVVAPSQQGVYITTTSDPFNISGHAIVQIPPDATIKILIKSEQAGNVITSGRFTVSLVKE